MVPSKIFIKGLSNFILIFTLIYTTYNITRFNKEYVKKYWYLIGIFLVIVCISYWLITNDYSIPILMFFTILISAILTMILFKKQKEVNV